MRRLSLIVWLVLTGVDVAYGQATEGTILGTVVDSSGAVVPRATVTITRVQTGALRGTVTNEQGEYAVTDLPLGSYTVTVEADGFAPSTTAPVQIEIKSRLRVDVQVRVGAIEQSVEVRAVAPLIKTDTPEVGGVISRQVLQDVPVFGRNFLAVASLVPGTTSGPRASRQRDLAGESVTIGGASAEANNFIIDGVSNNMEFSGAMGVVPAIDAIQEFAIQTSQYSAEFGRSGGGVVSLAIKSGTNEFHGFGYDYLRHDALDARPEDFGQHLPKTPLRRNQFGGGLGGPIVRGRLFFFGNYEGLRLSRHQNAIRRVPTALEKAGDFSRSGFTVYDPDTAHPDPANPSRLIRSPFPGNVIPSDRFNPITTELLRYFPEPNFTDPNPSVLSNYLANETADDTVNSFNVKSDVKVGATGTVTGRYSQQRGGRARSSWFPNDVIGAVAALDATNTGVSYTRVLGPRLVNEARVGYNYLRFGNDLLAHENVLSPFGIPGLGSNPAANGYPLFEMRNMTSASIVRPIASLPTPFVLREHSWQVLDNVTWQKAAHVLKVGVEYGRMSDDRFQGLPGNAAFGFNGSYTTAVVGGAPETLAIGVPDALLGLASRFSTQFVQDAVRLRSNRFSAFVQDDWRATTTLTVSLGLRYDIVTPYREIRDRVVNFDFDTGQRLLPESTRPLIEAVLGLPNGDLPPTFRYADPDEVIPKTNYTNVAPRTGFAYAISDRLVVRGGYGMFYGVTVANTASNAGTDPPFFTQVNLPSELDRPILIDQGFPTGSAAAPLAVPSLDGYHQPLDRPDPVAHKYSLNVQVSPFSRTSIEVGYMGQRARNYPLLNWLNVPPPALGAVQDRRPFPAIGRIIGYLPGNDSSYDGLEVTVKQRNLHGLTLQSAFTLSKALGYTTGTDGGLLANPLDARYSFGPLDYDVRTRWVTSWIYRIPTPQQLSAVLRHLLDGWETAGLITLQGGFPFSVGITGQVLNNGVGGGRPDVLWDATLPSGQRTTERWFDTGAFAMPPANTYGNAGKNTLRGPGFAQVDLAVQKSLSARAGARATVRAEVANLFNRVNLDIPAATFNGAGFGVIRSLGGTPRSVQLAFRFDF